MTFQSSALELEAQGAIKQFYANGLSDSAIPARWLYAAVGISGAIVAGLLALNRLPLAWGHWSFTLMIAVFAGLGAARFGLRDGRSLARRRMRDFAEYLMLMVALSAIGGIASYAAASDTHGFTDPLLAGLDERLHFNWLDWYQVVVRHPLLQHLGAAAYGSIYISPLAMLASFAWAGDKRRARRFLFTFWLAAAMTLMLFPLFPAKGALEYLWHGPIPYMPTNGLYQGQIIPALRAHSWVAINLGELRGLVCAPSFHTVCATLYIATALPLPRLRWVLVPLNLAMLVATPVEGTHYLSDMVLGFIVAMTALGLVRALGVWLARRRMTAPSWG
jgi:hypothetical protein